MNMLKYTMDLLLMLMMLKKKRKKKVKNLTIGISLWVLCNARDCGAVAVANDGDAAA